MTAKSTGLGLPVRFQEWPSNGCSFAAGLRDGGGTSTSSSDWSLRTNCRMSWQPFCVDPSGRTSGGISATPGPSDHVQGWRQDPQHQGVVQVEEHKDGNGLHQLPAPRAHPAPKYNAYPPPVTSRGGHGLREQQPGGVRSSGPLRPTISLRGTPQRATPEIPRALGHPQMAPHLGRPMAGGARGDTVREEANGRTACGAVGGGVGNRDRYHPATRWVGSTSREG